MAIQASFVPYVCNSQWSAGSFFSHLGQTFTVGGTTFKLTDIDVCLSSIGNVGTVTADIYAVNGSGFPTGSSLSSGTTSSINTQTLNTSPTWTNITMSEVELSAGTQYALSIGASNVSVIENIGCRVAPCLTMYGSGLPYTGGKPVAYGSSNWTEPYTWQQTRSQDNAFRVSGDSVAGYIDVSGTITFTTTLYGTMYLTETIAGSFDPPVATGLNFMSPIRRLVAAADNAIYYEDI